MIKIENLRMEFEGGVTALDGINMEIQDGEFIALLGPSGCGKIHHLKLYRRTP